MGLTRPSHGRSPMRLTRIYSGAKRLSRASKKRAALLKWFTLMQESEFERESSGYGIKYQAFVGVGYFDRLAQVIAGGESSITALKGSTEEEQFAVSLGSDA